MRRDLLRFLSSFSRTRRREARASWAVLAGTAVLGAAAGAGAYALLGPQGRRRRGLLGDRVRHALHGVVDTTEMAARDLGHRTRGAVAEARHAVRLREQVSDETLLERARAALGHACSHPHGIHIDVRDGELDIYGPVLAEEVDRVLRALRHVHGVRTVRDHLDVSNAPGNIPSLQGVSRRQGPRSPRWTPAARLLALGAGGALAVWGLVRRAAQRPGQRLGSTVATVAGTLLMIRAASNRDARALLGVGIHATDLPRRGVHMHKTIHVRAPLEEVFARFAQLEAFPRYMSHIKDVQRIHDDTGAQRFRWRVEGPLGISASWEALITRMEPNRLIAWQSVDGSMVHNMGSMRFESQPDGTTRMTLQLAYEPPAGAVGQAVARLFGHDAKKLLDDDLLRFQSLLETGHTTGREGQVSAEDVQSRSGGAIH